MSYLDENGNEIGQAPGFRGMLAPGNIDLGNRPRVRNPDGSVSTVRSLGVNFDGREYLIPTVTDDGRVVSDDEAIKLFQRTGKHLGVFDSPANATAYAQQLHSDQAKTLETPGGPSYLDDEGNPKPSGYLAGAESIGATPWYDQGVGAIVGMRGRGPTVRDALDTLPTIGGAVGGVVGGAGGTAFGMGVSGAPGAIAGSALGGGAGEAARQQIGDLIGIPKPQTAMERTKAIGTEAAIQGAAEAGGRVLATGAKALGRGMVENAVRPSMTIQREFPNVIDTIVKERLPVGAGIAGGAKGSERAALRLAEESKAVKELLAKSTAGGKSFETSKLAEPVLKLLDDVAEQPLQAADMKRLETMLDEFTAKKGPLSPTDVQKLKQRAQTIAKPIYKAAAMGLPVSADQTITGRFNAAIATGAKDAMETIPGVAEGEAKKRELIGAKKALTAAETKRLSLMGEIGSAVVGSAAGNVVNIPLDNPMEKSAVGWLIARGLLSPRSLSRAGLALTSAEAAALLKQQPRLAAYLFRNAARSQTDQSPPTAGR